MKNKILISVLALLGFTSCTRMSDFQLDFAYDYYPLEIGHTTVYEVDSIIYSPLLAGGRDTFYWERKVVIVDTLRDAEGRKSFLAEEYRRRKGNSFWEGPEMTLLIRASGRIEYQANNLRLIPFVFPPMKGKQWDGAVFIPDNDTFNFYRNWNNVFLAVDEPYELGSLSVAKSARVLETDDENLLEYHYSEARYARDIGLIERIQFNLKFVGSVIPNEPWEEKATNGYIMHQRLIRYE